MSATNQQKPDTDRDRDRDRDNEWSAPKLIGLGAVVLACFFIFIYKVSP
jgi:hypothetical protein